MFYKKLKRVYFIITVHVIVTIHFDLLAILEHGIMEFEKGLVQCDTPMEIEYPAASQNVDNRLA